LAPSSRPSSSDVSPRAIAPLSQIRAPTQGLCDPFIEDDVLYRIRAGTTGENTNAFRDTRRRCRLRHPRRVVALRRDGYLHLEGPFYPYRPRGDQEIDAVPLADIEPPLRNSGVPPFKKYKMVPVLFALASPECALPPVEVDGFGGVERVPVQSVQRIPPVLRIRCGRLSAAPCGDPPVMNQLVAISPYRRGAGCRRLRARPDSLPRILPRQHRQLAHTLSLPPRIRSSRRGHRTSHASPNRRKQDSNLDPCWDRRRSAPLKNHGHHLTRPQTGALLTVGPGVRIRLPPAGSQLRT
jgi:hypothetical protein